MAYLEGFQFTDPGQALARRVSTGRTQTDRTSDPLVRALSSTRRRYHDAVRREDGSAAARYEAQYGALERQRRAYLLRQAAGREVR